MGPVMGLALVSDMGSVKGSIMGSVMWLVQPTWLVVELFTTVTYRAARAAELPNDNLCCLMIVF